MWFAQWLKINTASYLDTVETEVSWEFESQVKTSLASIKIFKKYANMSDTTNLFHMQSISESLYLNQAGSGGSDSLCFLLCSQIHVIGSVKFLLHFTSVKHQTVWKNLLLSNQKSLVCFQLRSQMRWKFSRENFYVIFCCFSFHAASKNIQKRELIFGLA